MEKDEIWERWERAGLCAITVIMKRMCCAMSVDLPRCNVRAAAQK